MMLYLLCFSEEVAGASMLVALVDDRAVVELAGR